MKKTELISAELPKRGGATAEQIANYLGVSCSTIYRLEAEDPTFPKPKRILRSVRWDVDEIIEWFSGDRLGKGKNHE